MQVYLIEVNTSPALYRHGQVLTDLLPVLIEEVVQKVIALHCNALQDKHCLNTIRALQLQHDGRMGDSHSPCVHTCNMHGTCCLVFMHVQIQVEDLSCADAHNSPAVDASENVKMPPWCRVEGNSCIACSCKVTNILRA